MIPETFHFLRPYWLWAFLPGLLLIALYATRRWHGSAWSRVCDSALLPYVLIERAPGSRGHWPLLVLTSTLALSIVALAGPTWERLPRPLFRQPSTVVIALDLSPSMNTPDIAPSRLARARFKIADLLKLRKDGQTAMLVYAAEAYTVTPLTDDVRTISAHLPVLRSELMPSPGSNVTAAIDKAQELARQGGAQAGHLLIVTDGIEAQLSPILARVANSTLRVSVLGAGTAAGAPIPAAGGGFLKNADGAIVMSSLQEPGLRELAAAGGGIYQRLNTTDADIQAMQTFFDSEGEEQAQTTTLEMDQWREAGPLLVLLILPLAALGFRRGCLTLVALLLLPPPSHGLEWRDLWLNDDQRAQSVFQAGDPAKAAAMFDDPNWKAAAHYQAGEFEPAADALTNTESADSSYNKGNALARLGRYQEAIGLYEQALTVAPDHEDAAFNRDLLRELLSQQSPPDDSSQNDEQQDGSDEQQSGEDQSNQQQDKASEPSESGQKHSEQQPDDTNSAAEQQPDPQEQEQEPQSAEQISPQTDEAQEEDPAPPPALADSETPQDNEQEQATEQWLRRIPDDPGGLLRRKFLYQYQRSEQSDYSGDPW